MARNARIVIVGAGIGGLVAAAALRQAGFEVVVQERATSLGEVGAGLQIGPNAVKVLRGLGVLERFRAVAAEPTNVVSLRHDDAGLRFREPLSAVSQRAYGDIYLTAHRADLHALLCTLVPEASIAPWWAVFAPAKTPPEVIGRLEGWFNTISSAPENRAPLVALGVEPLPGTSAGTVTLMAESMRSWENITRLARIDPQ